MSKMVDVRGTVRAIADVNLHLGVELSDGQKIIGQRHISGKEVPPIDSPITRCFLSDGEAELPADEVPLPKRNRKLIEQAEVICYPPGSLYSSVITNLLPSGVGRAVARRRVPKVYMPSLGRDPEALGHDLADQVSAILAPLRKDAGPQTTPRALMTHVFCDESWSETQCARVTSRHGIPCHRLPLSRGDAPRYDVDMVSRLLVSLN